MASISNSDAELFSVNDVPGRYRLDRRPTSQLFRLLPFVPVDGHKLVANVIDVGESLFDYADAAAAGDPAIGLMPSPKTVDFEIKRLAAELQVDGIVSGLYGSHNDLVHALVKLKVEAVRDLFKSLVIRGDTSSSSSEFEGLARLASASGPFQDLAGANGRTITANNGAGGTVQPGEVEELLTLINPRSGPESCYLVMHSKGYRHLRENGYPDMEFVSDPHFGVLAAISGVSILIDNFIPTDEGPSSDSTSVYAVVLGEHEGLCGIYPRASEGDMIQVRGPYVKGNADRDYYHVTWDVGLACLNSGAVARLERVQVA